MTQSAADRARGKWGLSSQSPVLIKGSGDGLQFDDATGIARGLMPQLVSLNGIVQKTTLAELDSLFTSFGLRLLTTETKSYNAPGQMLFYQRGRLLVRIKTKGNPPNAPYRANQPHLSVGLMQGDQDLSFQAEMVKFSPSGRAQPKSANPKASERFLLPIKGSFDNPQYDGDANLLAASTHFNFPPAITLVT